jgi:hypothetical protein
MRSPDKNVRPIGFFEIAAFIPANVAGHFAAFS